MPCQSAYVLWLLINPETITEENTSNLLPLINDGLNVEVIANKQKIEFCDLWELDEEEGNGGVLYSTKLPRKFYWNILAWYYRKLTDTLSSIMPTGITKVSSACSP